MSTTYTFTLRWASGASTRSQDISVSDSAALIIDEAVADSSTDYEIACTLDQSEIAGLWIESDQDVTLETNDGSAPDDTISLRANEPLVWYTNSYYTCPITADVTALFITNASGDTANVRVRALYDATP